MTDAEKTAAAVLLLFAFCIAVLAAIAIRLARLS